MLIEILRFDGVAVHQRSASQCEIALVLAFGIGEGMAALVGVRPARL
jgi:dolichol kinase